MESPKPYSPWASHKFSRAKVEEIFGSKANGTVAQRLFNENPELYRELRAEAVSHGILENPRPNPWWGRAGAPKERTYSNEEIAARAQFTEQECKEWFGRDGAEGNRNNVGNLAKENPAKYAALRAAAVSYGILPETPNTIVQRTPKPAQQQPVDDGKVAIGEDLARRANLPVGLRVDQGQLNKIIEAVASVELARREAEKVAVEGDKQ